MKINNKNSEWIVSFNSCENHLKEKIGSLNEISEDKAYNIGGKLINKTFFSIF